MVPIFFDADGNRFIELLKQWGSMVLANNHPEVAGRR